MKNARMKRQETENRQTVRNNEGASAQIVILDTRLGVGIGAEKERNRLNKIINGG